MQADPFAITTDPARRQLTITFDSVFWDIDAADRFKRECLAAVASLHCGPGRHVVLVDLRNAIIQSQDVFERMQALVTSATAARIALVAATPLARMQTKRLRIRDNVVMFADPEDAEAWLHDDGHAAQNAA